MSTQVQRRWGIVALGVVMLLATMILNSMNGRHSSLYYFVWMMVSYYGYKGNLTLIKELMKWLIIINIAILLAVLLFFDEHTITYIANSKESLSFSVFLMLIPKAILYFYVDDELKKDNSSVISNIVKADKPKVQPSNLYKIPSMEEAYTLTQSSSQTTNQATQPNIDKQNEVAMSVNMNDDKLWEVAIVEFDGESRKKGLWAKCFADADGDENKAKASYLKLRVTELKSEVGKVIDKVELKTQSQIVQNSSNEGKPTTISCPMCHTTNLRTRDDCVSCKYDLRALKRMF